jgi:hypothetical protein
LHDFIVTTVSAAKGQEQAKGDPEKNGRPDFSHDREPGDDQYFSYPYFLITSLDALPTSQGLNKTSKISEWSEWVTSLKKGTLRKSHVRKKE